jgi:hypothetical protein
VRRHGPTRTENSSQDGWTSRACREEIDGRRRPRRWRRRGKRGRHCPRCRKCGPARHHWCGRSQCRAQQAGLAVGRRVMVCGRPVSRDPGVADDAEAAQRGRNLANGLRHCRTGRQLRGHRQQRQDQATKGAARTHLGTEPIAIRRVCNGLPNGGWARRTPACGGISEPQVNSDARR